MERGSCDISNIISIFCQVQSCKKIRSSGYGSKVTTHFVAGTLKMALTTEERIEVILMSGERSCRVIAVDFNNRHPERLPISHNTGRFLISKFRETETVADSVSRYSTFWTAAPCLVSHSPSFSEFGN